MFENSVYNISYSCYIQSSLVSKALLIFWDFLLKLLLKLPSFFSILFFLAFPPCGILLPRLNVQSPGSEIMGSHTLDLQRILSPPFDQRTVLHLKIRKTYLMNYGLGCVAQSSQTLCGSMDCNPPGFSAHGIFLARLLESIAISPSRASSPSKDGIHISCTAGRLMSYFQKIYLVFVSVSLQ